MEITVHRSPQGWRWRLIGAKNHLIAFGAAHAKKRDAEIDAWNMEEWLAALDRPAPPAKPEGRYAPGRRNR